MDTWFIKTSGQDFYKCVIFKHLAAKKAEFIGLTPGPHHIKLAIAATDLRNSEWGGAAFIAYGIPLLVIGAVVGLCIAVYLTRKI